MDLNICLCKVCNCKDWKTKMENENKMLENENKMLKSKLEILDTFDRCD